MKIAKASNFYKCFKSQIGKTPNEYRWERWHVSMKYYLLRMLIPIYAISLLLGGCSAGSRTVKDNVKVPQDINKEDNEAADRKNTIEDIKNTDKRTINVWTYNSEMNRVIQKFRELHPDFGYEINVVDYSNSHADYQSELIEALSFGGVNGPDIYSVKISYSNKFTKGEAHTYAADFKELIEDVDTRLAKASIAKYIIDIGTDPKGRLVGLGYQSTAGAFIYRRSIAKDVWGTDDPSVIQDIIGPGWDKFFEAAKDLREENYGICSSIYDI